MANTHELPTLLDLAQVREQQADRIGFTFHGERGSEVLDYGTLGRNARRIAAVLQQRGLAGSQAVLMYPPGLDYIAAFLGCIYANVVAVPAYPPASERTLGRLYAVLEDARASVVLTTAATLAQLRAKHAAQMASHAALWLATDQLPDDAHGCWRRPDIHPDQLAFLQYTSGSTGKPKGVMLSHRNLLSNLATICDGFRLHAGSKGMIWLPPYHDMGLIGGILAPLFAGFPVSLMAPAAFLKRPQRWLELIAEEKATCSGAPDFAYALCVEKVTPEQRASLDLSSWELAFCGAEPIRAQTLQSFSAAFAPAGFRAAAFYPCYGLAEATLMVSGGQAGAGAVVRQFDDEALRTDVAVAREGGRTLVGCGVARPGTQLRIGDADGASLADGQVGEVMVAGPGVAAGYWNRPPRGGEWLATGDLGFLCDGQLFITGRSKEVLIVRGRNYYPHDIEASMQAAHAALEAGAGVAFLDGQQRLVLVQELRRTWRKAPAAPILAAIRAAVAGDHGLQAADIVLLAPGALDKTSSGKLQRHQARQRYLAGGWPGRDGNVALPAPTTLDRWDALLAQLSGLAPAQIDDAHTLLELGLDSLQMMEVHSWLAARIDVRADELLAGARVGELRHRLAAGAPAREGVPAPDGGVPPAPDAAIPLAPEQRQFWLLDRLLQPARASHALHIAARIALDGALDVAALRAALARLVAAQPALRASYHLEQGQPWQRCAPPWTPALPVIDLEPLASAQRGAVAEGALRALADAPFDLAQGRPFRLVLFRHRADGWELGVVLHHIAGDYASIAAMLRGLSGAGGEGRYLEHARAPRPVGEAALDYWRRQLAGTRPLQWPAGAQAAAAPALRLHGALDGASWQRVRAHARAHGMTPFMVLASAYLLALHRHCRQARVAVATVVSTRTALDRDTVGCYVNVAPLVAEMAPEQCASAYAQRVRALLLDGMRHAAPFEALAPMLRGQAGELNAALVMQGAEGPDRVPLAGAVARLHSVLAPAIAHHDLRLIIGEQPLAEGLALAWEHKAALAGSAQQLARLFDEALAAIMSGASLHCDAAPSSVPMASAPPGGPRGQPPATALERQVAGLWSEMLGTEQVGTHDQFFALGGTSIQLVQLWSRLESTLGAVLPQQLFFSGELTVARTAQLLAEQGVSAPPALAAPAPAAAASPLRPPLPARPLDRAQTLHYLVHQLAPEGAPHHVVRMLEAGDVEVTALRQWWQLALAPVAAHWGGAGLDGLLAARADVGAAPHLHADFSQAGEAAAQAWLARQIAQPFELSHGPLLRTLSVQLAHGLRFGCIAHPLALDEAGMAHAFRNFERVAQGLAATAAPAAVAAPSHTAPPLDLPLDRGHPLTPEFAISRVAAPWPVGWPGERVPAPSVLLAALQALMYRLTGQRQFWVGHDGMAVPVTVDGHASFADLCAGQAQGLPLQAALDSAGEQGMPAHHPLYQVGFDWLPTIGLPSGAAFTVDMPRSHGLLDLRLKAGAAGLALEYRCAIFDAATARQLLGYYTTLLGAMLEQPALPLSQHPYAQTSGTAWQGVRATVPPAHLLAALGAHARRQPHKMALRCGDEQLSYEQLDNRSDELARQLQAHGIGRGSRVGVCLGRSGRMLVALLAVLKAGAAYVPLDPGFPRDRLVYICGDASLALLLTETAVQQALRLDVPALLLDALPPPAQPTPPAVPRGAAGPDDLAYLIYTSGSTGQPKGVMVGRAALDNFLYAMAQRPGLGEHDVLAAVTTLSFDIAGLELLLPLTVGASIILLAREQAMHGPSLIAGMAGANVMQATPVTWQMMVDAGWMPPPGFTVLCGGEAFPPALAARLLEGGARVWNMYGPTETTIWSMVEQLQPGQPVTLGEPIHNTTLHVLDAYGVPVPPGCVGELAIGGLGLAHGYWGRPELTAERFSMHGEERLYRTGDLVRMRGGRLHYLGRNDHQLKIRGYRVELAEIEQLLSQLCGRPALVAAYGSGAAAALAAYVPREVALPDTELRRRLGALLPAYMVPSCLIRLDTFPLTPNGKFDRNRLPLPQPQAAPYVAPDSPVEMALATLFSQVLGAPQVGMHTDYGAMGGDHWGLLQIHRALPQLTGAALSLHGLLSSTVTPAALAEAAEDLLLQSLEPEILNSLLGELDLS